MWIKNSFPKKFSAAVLMLAAAGLAGTLSARPRLATGDDAEITYDGLHRVERTVVDAAWVKPDLDLRPYTQLMLVGAGFSYRPVDNEGERYRPGRSNDSEFYISEENRARIELEMREAFLRELEDLERYEVVDTPGPGVLMLVAGVIDVVSSVPNVNDCVGRCEVYLRSVGEATLVVELRDSMSNEVLVRAVDRRAAESGGFAIQASAVTVWPEVRRLAGVWGRRIVKGLNDFESIDDLR